MIELLGDGLQIAIFGMAVVFLLLGCLVGALGLMSRLAAALEPVGAPPGPGPDELAVVVAAAIHMHRRRRR